MAEGLGGAGQDEARRQKRAVKARLPTQHRAPSLEERERGFQLYVSGANQERVEEARRRQQSAPSQQSARKRSGDVGSGLPAGLGREWQVETVELRGKDGALYRCSPHKSGGQAKGGSNMGMEVYADEPCEGCAGSEIGEEIGDASDGEGSRPSTGGSAPSSTLDREARGVLKMMQAANRGSGSLSASSPGMPPRISAAGRSGSARRLDAAVPSPQWRPSSGCSAADPSRPSSAASIASAIQAENARVRRLTEGGGEAGEEGSSSRPPSRPSSKPAPRLPLSPEEAAGCAPPSVIGSAMASSGGGGSGPSRPPAAAPSVGRFGDPVLGAGSAPLPPPAPGSLGYPGGSVGGNLSARAAQRVPVPQAREASPLRGYPGEVRRIAGSREASPVAPAREPGSNAAPPAAVTPGTGQALPIWLSSGTPLGSVPVRKGFDDDDNELEASLRRQESPKHRSPRPKPSGENQELEKSLRALEQFRSSQSRRFFGQLHGSQDFASTVDGGSPVSGASASGSMGRSPKARTTEDWRPGELAAAAQASAGGPWPAAKPPALSEPAEADAPQHAFSFDGQDMSFDGLDIPVRGGFDGVDACDGFFDNRPGTVMGSSLVAGRFSPSQSVIIPTLPRGRSLVFNCVSTWGDESFVGLAGIEIFDGRGFPVVLKDPLRQVTADPHSINVLPEYEHDPRTPDKLFDQVNLTRDDLHVWLAPFFPGRQAHTVTVDLERPTSISMIRVWNYNKSRLHNSRGVRDMEILLDGQPVFVGEIRRAPGVLTDPEEACEHILFTQDEAVLQAIEEHDWLPEHLPLQGEAGDEEDADELPAYVASTTNGLEMEGRLSRPPTPGMQGRPRGEETPRGAGADGRPLTRASVDRQHVRGCSCGSVTLVIHSTWGDQYYVGLTAIEVLNASLEPIPLSSCQIDASPRDLNDLEGVDGDLRTVDKLVDGVGCTMDDSHMWLAPFLKAPNFSDAGPGRPEEPAPRRNLLKLDFAGARHEVGGFNLWNYNKSQEDACRGVKEFSVFCDDRYIATFLCRKAPGHVNFDFKQVVLLDQPPSADTSVRRAPPAAPRMPSRGPVAGERRGGVERPGSREGRRPSSREPRRSSSQERPT